MSRTRIWLLVFLLGSSLLYGAAAGSNFLSDDWHWLWVARERGSILPDFFANTAGTVGAGSYNPASSLWIHVLYRFFGSNPEPYHWASILLHGLTSWLVALCAVCWLRLVRPEIETFRENAVALAAGFLFLVWPTHAEAVIWISSVPHLLATFFYILSLWAYCTARRTGARHLHPLALGAAFLAFFSKESALSLPFVLLALEIMYARHRPPSSKRRQYWTLAHIFVAALVFILIRYAVTHVIFGTYADEALLFRPGVWGHTFLTFFVEMFTMGIWRKAWSIAYFNEPLWIFAKTSVGLLILLWYAFRKRAFHELGLIVVFVISILPYLPLGFNRLVSDGERYTYLPSVFFIIFLVSIGARFKRAVARRAIGSCIVVLSVGLIILRTQAWIAAGSASDLLVKSFESHVSEPREYVLVGLPDTIDGAHAFRNAVRESIALAYPDFTGTIVPVPVYTQLSAKMLQDPPVTWTADERGIFARGPAGSLLFTGRDRAMTDLLTYELWGYRYDAFSSDTVRLIFSDELKQKLSDGTASLLTWGKGGLAEVPWRPLAAQNR